MRLKFAVSPSAPFRCFLPLPFLLLLRGFSGLQVGNFIVDILLDCVWISTNYAAPVDEDGWRAANFEKISIGDAGINFASGLRRAHAGLEGVLVDPSLASILEHLVPDVGGRDQVLIIVNQIVELPECLGVLLVGAASG